jgi:cytochrome c oxidase assembly protein subunit 15
MDLNPNMSPVDPNRWVRRAAVATACVAMLPIIVGAVVTTKDAGMAFRDWPSSDGHNMLSYPWLKSAGDKFLEHGHRLAGIVIGLSSIVLVVVTWRNELRRWVRSLSVIILLCVIAQGILGGQRVLLDERGLAFFHGLFAACVFCLMAIMAVVTGPKWFSAAPFEGSGSLRRVRTLSAITIGVTFVQYLLGGLVRHRGTVLHEHLGFAFVVLICVALLFRAAYASRHRDLTRLADQLAGLVVLQLLLGAGAWVTKFGFGNYVAVHGSAVQTAVRTSHVVVGMLLLMSAVVMLVRTLRLLHVSKVDGRDCNSASAAPRNWPGAPAGLWGGVA